MIKHELTLISGNIWITNSSIMSSALLLWHEMLEKSLFQLLTTKKSAGLKSGERGADFGALFAKWMFEGNFFALLITPN